MSTDQRAIVILDSLKELQISSEMAVSSRASRRASLTASLAAADNDETRRRIMGAFSQAERSSAREMRRRKSIDDFEILTVIGRGAFGEVMLVRDRLDKAHGDDQASSPPPQLYALKVLDKRSVLRLNQFTHSSTERLCLVKTMSDPGFVRLHATFQSVDKAFLLFEFHRRGDLMSLLIERDTLQEDHVRIIAAELILTLEALHTRGFIHRDVKPDNVLIALDGHVLLT